MADLSGSLARISFPDVLRFLAGLQKSGCLRITHERWTAEVYFDHGQAMAASCGAERGLAALDAVVLALSRGQFTFTEGGLLPERTVELTTEQLAAHLERVAAQHAG